MPVSVAPSTGTASMMKESRQGQPQNDCGRLTSNARYYNERRRSLRP